MLSLLTMKKVCIKCGVEKPFEEFPVRTDSKDGRRNDCTVCHRKRAREYGREHSDHRKEYMKQWRIENPGYMDVWVKENYEQYLNNSKQWKIDNPVKAKQHKKEWGTKRSKNDPKYRLKNNLRTAVRSSLRRKGYSKKSKTYKILGIDYEGFYNYIESQFVDGMSWENKDEWELDHKIPISIGNTEEDIIRLNHYTNFRPLWRKDNQLKSNKILPEFEHLIDEYIN